jgi:choline dehydrogenase-like flavoprotein
MIEDLNEFDDGARIQADVCIIGAGAAGITLAREFLGAHFNVALLESGGLDNEPATQKLNESEVLGLPHAGIEKGRVRALGGTSTVWGGQTLRLGTFDFQKRSWVPNSGWPITLQDIEPYYARAEQVLQLGPNVSYETLCARAGIKPLRFDSGSLYMECSRWSPGPNFGTTYRNDLKKAGNVSVILHANVSQIVTNPTATLVERVEVKTLAGKTATVIARFYVVCCGGIESARLLLASDKVEKRGVGNKHDLVGRYFQDHVHIWYDDIVATDRKCLQNLCESFFINGRKYAPLVTLGEKIQAEKQLLRIQGSVIFWMEPDSSVAAVKSLFRAVRGRTLPGGRELRESVGRALGAPGELLHLAYRYLIQKRAATPKSGRIYLAALCEMAPDPNSRITLSEARDPLGIRRARIDWRIGELERRTALEYARTVASEFARLGIGSYDLKQVALLEDPAGWVRMATDNNHHMGTIRMHESDKLGVVDPNCKVHGVDNLYIGSSAVFPSSASSHPTLTILALCIRIADRLKGLLNNAEPVRLEEQLSCKTERATHVGDGHDRNQEA